MDIKRKIDALLKDKRMTVKDILEDIDMSETGYYQMLKNHSMKITTLEKIAAKLEVPIIYFLETETVTNKKVEDRVAIYRKSKSHVTLELGANDIVMIDMKNRVLDITKGG